MFRETLMSAYHQREEERHSREAEGATQLEGEVREHIARVFGPEWAECAEVNGRHVRIEDIELFVGHYSAFSDHGHPTGNFLLVCGRCPHCGRECWSRECYSAASVGEQLVDFQVSWTRHECWVSLLRRARGFLRSLI